MKLRLDSKFSPPGQYTNDEKMKVQEICPAPTPRWSLTRLKPTHSGSSTSTDRSASAKLLHMQRQAGLLFFFLLTAPLSLAETFLILPFFNLSNVKNVDWIGDSLSETIQESLARESVLTVPRAQRDRAMEELGIRRHTLLTRATIIELAMNLDATSVVYGSYEFGAVNGPLSEGPVALRAAILDVRRLRRGPNIEEKGQVADLSRLQSRLAWKVLGAVQPGLSMTEEKFMADHPPVRLDALRAMRGLLATTLSRNWHCSPMPHAWRTVFSEPCFQLGRIHFERKDYRAAAEWLQRVLLTDSHYRESQFLMGLTRYHLVRFLVCASENFAKVAARSMPAVLNNLGVAQLRAGAAEVASLKRAVDNDEADPDYHFNLAYAHWRRGEVGIGFRELAVLERTPEDEISALLLARCEQAAGPKPGEPRFENLERLKTAYDESAWRHLQSILGPRTP